MRLIKMLGLAAVGAIVALAFVGAGTASAVSLCSSGEPEGSMEPLGETATCTTAYAEGTVVESSLQAGTEALLETNLGTVKCKKSTVSGKIGAKTVGTIGEEKEVKLRLIKIEAVTFTECKLGETKCEVTVGGLPYSAHLHLKLLEINKVLLHWHLTVLLGKAKVVCGSGFNCTFGENRILFTVHLISPVWVLLVNQALNREEGLFCPSTSTWNAKYEITKPSPITAIAME